MPCWIIGTCIIPEAAGGQHHCPGCKRIVHSLCHQRASGKEGGRFWCGVDHCAKGEEQHPQQPPEHAQQQLDAAATASESQHNTTERASRATCSSWNCRVQDSRPLDSRCSCGSALHLKCQQDGGGNCRRCSAQAERRIEIVTGARVSWANSQSHTHCCVIAIIA